ncbi:MAG: site-specific integrase [Flavobacteriales bacterium]|nr:MAG: site-specific integrase [Flavobacteriales bacterium]
MWRFVMHQYKMSRRRTKSGFTYTASFLQENGTYTSYLSLSTTCEKKAHQLAAAKLAERQLALHIKSTEQVKPRIPSFAEYSNNFYDWDGKWAKSKRSLNRRTSQEQCERLAADLKNHLLPFFGQYMLDTISISGITNFRVMLFDQGKTSATINHILGALGNILNFAVDEEILVTSPKIARASIYQPEKGILNEDEIHKLWNISWEDKRTKVAMLIGHICGYRQGEILGIRLGDIKKDHIEIEGSWNTKKRGRNKLTKNYKKHRTVPITEALRSEIEQLIDSNPYKRSDSYLFYSSLPNKPMEHNVLIDNFYAALASIGIDEKQRKERNITFHSSRHFFNTLMLRGGLSVQVVQLFTGHLTKEMTERYNHTHHEDPKLVRGVQERFCQKT